MTMRDRSLINSILVFIFFLTTTHIHAQSKLKENEWVDSVYRSLSMEERIGQLMTIRANNVGKDYLEHVSKYIKDYNIGGITFFKNTPTNQAKQTNEWQLLAKTPLLISIDGEYGLGMRLDSLFKFPFQMTLGAIQNDSLIYEMGKDIAWQCKRLGIQMNFAPVVDININPKNPVINSRSFGEDKKNVSRKGIMYMKGLQDAGIIATAKHFPGHGDTDTDSHKTLPIIKHKKSRLKKVELYPFKQLMKEGLGGVMIAHLYVPAYEKEDNVASTLSKALVTGLLKKKMKFKGLIVTDALEMKGVTKYFKPGNIELKALEAGNDILLLPRDVPKAIRKINRALKRAEIDSSLIENACKKILAYKYRAGLTKPPMVNLSNIVADINNRDSKYLNRKLYEEALTLVKNQHNLIPLKRIDTLKIASLVIGNTNKGIFQERLDTYAPVDHFYSKSEISIDEQKKLFESLKDYNLIIVGIQNTSISAHRKFGISQSCINFVNKLQKQNNIILDIFANPYSLAYFNTANIPTVVMSYQDNTDTHDLSAQLIFGGIEAKGKLPITATKDFPLNTGLSSEIIRLKYTQPEELNISQFDLIKVDSIILHGINEKAYPGCQVMAIKDGKVFYQKSFGNHTYTTNNPVRNTDIYDIASITKIAATTLSVMRFQEEYKLDIDQKISHYLPYFIGSNKEDVIFRDLLTHQAKFKSWIPYFKATLNKDSSLNMKIYQKKISDKYPTRVAENLYIKRNYDYQIMDSIIISSLRETDDYKYSDLGFYILAKTIENISNQPIDEYVQHNFYNSLGLNIMGFRPRDHFPLTRIVPTEEDTFFRKQLIHGDVHDPGAAMLGGVCGHAGLFSNANDLAVIMQMLLQKGMYGGQRYFKESTITEFTSCQFPLKENRRGLGFDKPLLEYDEEGPNCKSASTESYGHSGFTGALTWVDPENGLVYVFLSNRIHPDASNPKIYELDIRTNIHEAFYEALRNAKK